MTLAECRFAVREAVTEGAMQLADRDDFLVQRGPAMRKVTVAASLVADMAAYLRAHGVDADAVCRRAGIDPHAPADRVERVDGLVMSALWREAIAASGDPDLALHTGVTFQPGALDIVGYVMLSSHTAADALRRGARLIRLLNDGLDIELDAGQRLTTLRVRVLTPHHDMFRDHIRQITEVLLVGTVHQLRLLTGRPIVPHAVSFSHPRPGTGTDEHLRLFGVLPVFDAPECTLVLQSRDLAVTLRSTNVQLLGSFTKHADAALAALDSSAPLTARVTHALVTLMKGEAPTVTRVATTLAMSARNLQRGLAAEGTTFQLLLDEARRELAIRHLSEPNATVAHVAWLVGFSEPSAFHRAFRRWTGHSPRALSLA